ncbi:MAG: hypothetical protein IPG46_10425 [Actinobacteria bacterium]|nr:hypothetical protein [Actinomycetota bacterium]
MLDVEAELGRIERAVGRAEDDQRAQVRFLEVADLSTIRTALGGSDQFHVLHLSAHGSQTSIELVNEDGAAVQVSAGDLADTLRCAPEVWCRWWWYRAGRRRWRWAAALSGRGVPRVLAMRAWSDEYRRVGPR